MLTMLLPKNNYSKTKDLFNIRSRNSKIIHNVNPIIRIYYTSHFKECSCRSKNNTLAKRNKAGLKWFLTNQGMISFRLLFRQIRSLIK